MHRAGSLFIVVALGGCGGARPLPPATDDLDLAGTAVVDHGPGRVDDDPPAAPAQPVALVAALDAVGPITAGTRIPDDLPALFPGDTLVPTTHLWDGRTESAIDVMRGDERLLAVFHDAAARLTGVWIYGAEVRTAWNVPVGTSHADAEAALGPLACVALALEDAGRAGCTAPTLDNVEFVLEPVGVWIPEPRPGASDPRDDADGRFIAAPRGPVAPVQLTKARVTRIVWWP
ncbi:MAG: hypothetical protein R2939_07035 [Kofleriaceae bacterium]